MFITLTVPWNVIWKFRGLLTMLYRELGEAFPEGDFKKKFSMGFFMKEHKAGSIGLGIGGLVVKINTMAVCQLLDVYKEAIMLTIPATIHMVKAMLVMQGAAANLEPSVQKFMDDWFKSDDTSETSDDDNDCVEYRDCTCNKCGHKWEQLRTMAKVGQVESVASILGEVICECPACYSTLCSVSPVRTRQKNDPFAY